MLRKFLYPNNPAIKSLYNKIVYGRGNHSDFEEISRNFVFADDLVLEANDEYITDSSVYYLNKKKCYVARKTGFVYFNGKEISILPYLGVYEANLYSFIIIPVKGVTQKPLTEKIINDSINRYGFKGSINRETSKECMDLYQRSGGCKIIHQGTRMIPDRVHDILLDEKFNFIEDSFTLLEDRRILFPEEIEFFHLVEKGEQVAVFMPMIPGEDGEDVFGNPIPRTQIESFYKVGEGLEKKVNGDIIAQRKGIFRINLDGQLTVRESRVIMGDLKSDLKIEGPEDVIITGRIFANVRIGLKGDLVVIGSVEHISIDCGGNLLITNGINNRCDITVGKDCFSQFIANSQLVAGGNIFVRQYTLNSEIKAQKDVVVRNSQFGEIVGGSIESEYGNIETNSVGSVSGNATFLKVGNYTPRVDLVKNNKKLLKKLNNDKFSLEQKILKIKPLISVAYRRWHSDPKSLSESEREQFKNNILAFKKLQDFLKNIEVQIKETENILTQNDPGKEVSNRIKVFSGVFGGVTVQIKNIKYFFKYNVFKGFVLKKNPVLHKIDSHSLTEG